MFNVFDFHGFNVSVSFLSSLFGDHSFSSFQHRPAKQAATLQASTFLCKALFRCSPTWVMIGPGYRSDEAPRRSLSSEWVESFHPPAHRLSALQLLGATLSISFLFGTSDFASLVNTKGPLQLPAESALLRSAVTQQLTQLSKTFSV